MMVPDYAPLDFRSGVRVGIYHASYSERLKTLVIHIRYTGSAEALVAVGVATPEMVVPAPAHLRHIRRKDDDGDYFRLNRHYSSQGSEPYWRCRLTLYKPYERAMRLPDGFAAWLRYSNSEAWRRTSLDLAARHGIQFQRIDKRTKLSEPEPAILRLVVDNTGPLKAVERSSHSPTPQACPFCGSAINVVIYFAFSPEQCRPGEQPRYQCECEICGSIGPHASSQLEALRRWNRRSARSAPGPLGT